MPGNPKDKIKRPVAPIEEAKQNLGIRVFGFLAWARRINLKTKDLCPSPISTIDLSKPIGAEKDRGKSHCSKNPLVTDNSQSYKGNHTSSMIAVPSIYP
jgi:hypothetical protein